MGAENGITEAIVQLGTTNMPGRCPYAAHW
jgi:hypothetical protein